MVSSPPAEFLGDAFDLGDEFVVGTLLFYLRVGGGGPAVYLFDRAVAAAEGLGVFDSVFLCRGVEKDDL